MLVRLFVLMIMVIGVVDARTTEVREGTGVPTVDVYDVYGTFKSPYESRFPYVCYDRRVKVQDERYITYLRYEGCKRTDGPCHQFGQEHFGKYPNDYKAYQAFQRCVSARPRFVD
ncbi:MAG: hypothetical protein KU38_11865 [Sulfurovum sp. FS08-3]|nr:MAG: hypothetical protein KU38_11865 [Sulfurovum sp. FS08-3]